MDDMCKFLGHEMTPKLRETVAKRGEKQRKYESEHKYDLAKYGLNEEQVRRDFAFFYDAFLPPMEFLVRAAETA
jgi:omega-hydroxy-beta-dihydromenaquinone-9 sulfotransferase